MPLPTAHRSGKQQQKKNRKKIGKNTQTADNICIFDCPFLLYSIWSFKLAHREWSVTMTCFKNCSIFRWWHHCSSLFIFDYNSQAFPSINSEEMQTMFTIKFLSGNNGMKRMDYCMVNMYQTTNGQAIEMESKKRKKYYRPYIIKKPKQCQIRENVDRRICIYGGILWRIYVIYFHLMHFISSVPISPHIHQTIVLFDVRIV